MKTLTAKQMVEFAKQHIQEVDVYAVQKMLEDPNIIIIDVREPIEFSTGHIAGATNIPRGVLEFKLDLESSSDYPHLQNKDIPMVVYCRSGARSALAVQSIQLLGYRRAVSMIGGIEKWKTSNLPYTEPQLN